MTWNAGPDRDKKHGRWYRSRHFLGISWKPISRTRAMRAVAAASFVAWVVSFLVLFGPVIAWYAETDARWTLAVGSAVVAFPFLFTTTFFTVALLAGANACMDGQRLTARQSFAVAARRVPQIAGWSLLAAGVGAALEAFAEWVPGVGAVASWLLGTVWSLATLFAVPIIVVDGVGGRAAATRSAGVFQRQWGESLLGVVSIAFFTVVLTVPGCALVGAGAATGSGPGSVVLLMVGFGLIAVAAFMAMTVERLFALVLYRYLLEGEVHGGFTEYDLRDGLFFKTPRRRWYSRRP